MTSKCLVTFRERNFVLPFDGTLTRRGLVERVRDHELFRGIDVATLIFTMFEEDFNVFVDIPEDFEIRDREKISLRGLPGSDTETGAVRERDLWTTKSTAATDTGPFLVRARHHSQAQEAYPQVERRWTGLLDAAIVSPGAIKKHWPMSVLQHPRPLCDPSLVPYSQPLEGESLVAYDHPCASCMQAADIRLLFGAPDDILLFVNFAERCKNFTNKNRATCRLSKHKEPVPDNHEQQAAQLVKTTVHIGHYATVVRTRGVLVPVPHGPHCNIGALAERADLMKAVRQLFHGAVGVYRRAIDPTDDAPKDENDLHLLLTKAAARRFLTGDPADGAPAVLLPPAGLHGAIGGEEDFVHRLQKQRTTVAGRL
ncbi:hypothetical protein V5799_027390 [Amblyomma americanum]|uniref:Uncharacterized protein n=1 Tax=Amblyomma americanum TaxID=6943 RepID=A0AAQ4DFV3_AMBAM